MKHPYKTREGGATVTIFVPYDCKNHCPFCINKGEYADTTGFSLEKICESIRRMDAITPRCDFVFTGGEPFSNLESLQVMLDQIPATHKVYAVIAVGREVYTQPHAFVYIYIYRRVDIGRCRDSRIGNLLVGLYRIGKGNKSNHIRVVLPRLHLAALHHISGVCTRQQRDTPVDRHIIEAAAYPCRHIGKDRTVQHRRTAIVSTYGLEVAPCQVEGDTYPRQV